MSTRNRCRSLPDWRNWTPCRWYRYNARIYLWYMFIARSQDVSTTRCKNVQREKKGPYKKYLDIWTKSRVWRAIPVGRGWFRAGVCGTLIAFNLCYCLIGLIWEKGRGREESFFKKEKNPKIAVEMRTKKKTQKRKDATCAGSGTRNRESR